MYYSYYHYQLVELVLLHYFCKSELTPTVLCQFSLLPFKSLQEAAKSLWNLTVILCDLRDTALADTETVDRWQQGKGTAAQCRGTSTCSSQEVQTRSAQRKQNITPFPPPLEMKAGRQTAKDSAIKINPEESTMTAHDSQELKLLRIQKFLQGVVFPKAGPGQNTKLLAVRAWSYVCKPIPVSGG